MQTGGASGTLNNVAPGATSGVPVISQGSSSQPVFGTALVAGGGTASTSFNTTGVVISGATATTALAAVTLTDGQLAIGSSAGNPAAATLTAGTGITITNGHNSITINAAGGAMTWSVKSTSFNAAVNNGYFITGTATATLPASPSIGDEIAFFVQGAFTLTITGNTGQAIQIASNLSSAAGTQANTATGDACILVYDSTNTQWNALSFVGAWNKT